MLSRVAEKLVRDTFARADIMIGGGRPWDLTVRDPAFYLRMVVNPAFEIGETYVDGLWDCAAIDEMFVRLLPAVGRRFEQGWSHRLRSAVARVWNRQSRARAGAVAEHYDLGTDLYGAMLDESMTYTCAYWGEGVSSLDQAQRAKLDLVCNKLDLRPGETLLDIGCGFGGLARHAAEHYGARVTGITNAREHARVARERSGAEILLGDYRDLPALGRRFDKIASIEMIEAVGPKNFATYMDVVHRCLKAGGRFLLQSFVSPTSREVCNEWFDRHIFPNGVSPSLPQLCVATEGNLGVPRDLEDLGQHYPPTLLAWDANVRRAAHRLPYDQRFFRTWHFYLTCLAGVFRAGDLSLCQLVYGDYARMSRTGAPASIAAVPGGTMA